MVSASRSRARQKIRFFFMDPSFLVTYLFKSLLDLKCPLCLYTREGMGKIFFPIPLCLNDTVILSHLLIDGDQLQVIISHHQIGKKNHHTVPIYISVGFIL